MDNERTLRERSFTIRIALFVILVCYELINKNRDVGDTVMILAFMGMGILDVIEIIFAKFGKH